MKSTAVLRKYKPTPYERAGMYALDADLRKQYQRISEKPGERASLVQRAFAVHPSRYRLCHEVTRLTRLTHDSNSQRVPATVNRALGMLSTRVNNDGKKPVGGVTIAKDELRPWIEFLQTLPHCSGKAVRHG